MKVIGNNPIAKDIFGIDELTSQRIGDVQFLHDQINAVHAVIGMGHQGFGGIFAKAVEEVSRVKEASAIMRGGGIGVVGPIVQL